MQFVENWILICSIKQVHTEQSIENFNISAAFAFFRICGFTIDRLSRRRTGTKAISTWRFIDFHLISDVTQMICFGDKLQKADRKTKMIHPLAE